MRVNPNDKAKNARASKAEGPALIVVRRAELSDADSLAETAARAFPLGCPKGTPQSDLDRFIQTELTAERFASHIANRANELSVAMAGERMAGFSMLCKESPLPAAGARVIQCKNPLELRKIYVLPEFHGCGAGDALMRAAIARAKEVKAGCIWLSVSKFNERGLAFYRKHEFKVAGNATFLVGSDLQEDFLMVRQARASALPRK